MIYEMIHIVLGMELWGREVVNAGKCLLITAEDSREMTVARLEAIMSELFLTDEQVQKVRKDIWFLDISSKPLRLIETDKDIQLTGMADELVKAYKGENLALACFDPLVSFGASENDVNGNAHGLIAAGRVIKNGLDCCVRFIHHTGQQVLRDGIIDMYAGRGGSALADGARMVVVLQPWSSNLKCGKLPEGVLGEYDCREYRQTLLCKIIRYAFY